MSDERRLYFPKVAIHLGVVAFVACGVQIAVILTPTDTGPLRPILFLASYLLLLAFVAVNWRRVGIVIIGAGLILNFAPIAANGGLMPIAPEALAEIGELDRIDGLEPGDAISGSKNVLRPRDDTRIQWLSDRLVLDGPFFDWVYSIGDVVIAAGVVIAVAEIVRPRVTRARGLPS